MSRGHQGLPCLLFVFISISALFDEATSQYLEDVESTIYCFQCNSVVDYDCKNLQQSDTSSYHFKPCLDTDKYNGSTPFCRKIIQNIFPRENLEVVIRKCGWVRHPRLDCYSVRNEDHTETSCQCFQAGCNHVPRALASPALLLPALLVSLPPLYFLQ